MMLTAALGIAQMGFGIAGGLRGRKAAKKARKKQKRLIAQRMKLLNELGAEYQAGGRFYESAQKNLRTSQTRDIQDIMAARTRGFTKTTTSGAVRERYMTKAGGGRDQQMNLEEFLAEKYRGVQLAKSDVLGSINVQGPSSESISNSWAQAGMGLSTLLQSFQKQPGTDKMGSDITPKPIPSLEAVPQGKYSSFDSYRDLMKRQYSLGL